MDSGSTQNNDNRNLLAESEAVWQKIELDDFGDAALNKRNYDLLRQIQSLMEDLSYSDFDSQEETARYSELKEKTEKAEKRFNLFYVPEEDETAGSPEDDFEETESPDEKSGQPSDEDEDVPEFTQKHVEAGEMLEEAFDMWTDVSEEGGVEYRKPGSMKEAKASGKLLRKAFIKGGDHPLISDRVEELEKVLEEYYDVYGHDYYVSVWGTLLFIVIALSVLYFYDFVNDIDPVEYNQEWFTTSTSTWILKEAFVKPEERGTYPEKVRLPRNEQVEPIARNGSYIKIKSDDGQIGFVLESDFKGYKYIALSESTELYEEPNAEEYVIGTTGMKGEILNTRTVKQPRRTTDTWTFVQVKLEDESVHWVHDWDLHHRITDGIPRLNQTIYLSVTEPVIQEEMIGKSLETVEEKYYPAHSKLRLNGKNIAYFPQIDPYLEGKHKRSITLLLDNNDVVTGYEAGEKSYTRNYDNLPLAEFFMAQNYVNMFNLTDYYRLPDSEWEFWTNFKDWHWTTGIIGWIIDAIMGLIGLFLIFSIPRILAAPVMNLFVQMRFLSNGMVKFLNFFVYLFVSYCFVLIMAIPLDGVWIPAIGSVVVFAIYWGMHSSSIAYERCPDCHRMHKAEDLGSEKGSRVRETENSTYDVYKGSTTSFNTTTRHYERRHKKNVKIYQNYKDYRQCAACGAVWNVDRKELEEEWNEYD